MKKILTNHPVAAYYIILWLISLILVPAMNLNTPFIQIQFAPAISVLVFFLITGKNDLFTPLKNSMKLSAAHYKWFLLILPATLVPTAAISLALSFTGKSFSPWNNTMYGYISTIIGELVLGVTCEEIGWRGFMLPILHKKYSLFKSTMIVAVLWGIWHLPIYFSLGVTGCIIFFVTLIEFSLILTFFYAKGKGSLMLSIAAHICINASALLLYYSRMSQAALAFAALFFGIAGLVIVLSGKKSFFKDKYEDTFSIGNTDVPENQISMN